MSRIESRIGTVKQPAEKIFTYISNFDHFRSLIPEDRIKDFESSGDSCRFTIDGIGTAGLKMVEKVPHKLIKISSDEKTAFDLILWIQIREVNPGDSRIKITTEVNVSPLIAPMVNKPLQNLVNTLVDQAEKLSFDLPG
jgi:carbon monoxide dehydrogenase subunit G